MPDATKPLSDSAYPTNAIRNTGFSGMSLRAHAAIELRVPESGNPELDAMIRRARWLEVAGRAMQALISNGELVDTLTNEQAAGLQKWTTGHAMAIADALIEASEQEPTE